MAKKKQYDVANDQYEKELWQQGYKYVCGVDEVGMASIAGDVYVAAAIFPVNIDMSLLKDVNDSKQIKEKERERLYDIIKANVLDSAIGIASIKEIQVHNIFWARFIAARRAIAALKYKPDYVFMDGGFKIPEIDIEQRAIIKGDTKSISIAAASILAKVERDRYMIELAKEVPEEFSWKTNKGYYSPQHRKALEKYGKTKYHRDRFLERFDFLKKDEEDDE